jgi:rhodanese-related sulfurtransferase
MRSTIAFVALALAVTLVPAVRAETNAGDDSLHKVTIEELVALRAANKVTAVDANNEIARSRFGSIPGAIMLSSYGGYDVKELPKDHHQKLVFYCANEKCMASHTAAHKAIDAGYKDVNVLPAGIMGWRDAGQPTNPAGT